MPTLHFKGKTFVQNHHLAVKYHQLVPKKELSLTDKVSLHDNLIIQGDNLKALKALLPTYSGKVKCIYIDPPYNTGNENWVYNDNVNSPMIKEWLGNIVDKDDMTRHDKWLCMMMPRLKLLRELLSEDGVIFISIDDNEQHNLRCLMDEVFGTQHFIGQFTWRRRASSTLAENLASTDHEYVIAYGKFEFNGFSGIDKNYAAYSNPDDDIRGDWVPGDLTVGMNRNQRPNQFYELVDPQTGKTYQPNPNRVWAYIPESMDKLIKENRIIFPDDTSKRPMSKRFKAELRSEKNPISTWMDNVGLNTESTKLIQEIFGDKNFEYSKPLSLIKTIIKQITKESDIILDSFAGSGTTAHAVMELNKEDGGNRKFILVEMEDYSNTITAERVRRVIKGIPSAKSELLKKGTGGTFSYFELGNTIEMESLLRGQHLPTFTEFARYLFYTATGEEFNEKSINEETGFIGESKSYEVYLIYKPDIEWLKRNALTLEGCKSLPKFKTKQRLVFAPCKYVDDHTCLEYRIDFCQLPYEIYRIQR
jgi:adenine-specific DNA-methyltransferase